MNKILLITEHYEGKMRPVSFELTAAAWDLEKTAATGIIAVVLGSDAKIPAEEFARKTGVETIAVQIEGLDLYNSEGYRTLLLQLTNELKPKYILGAHSTQGLDYLPALAINTGAACITGVEKIEKHEGLPVFCRSICGGKFTVKMESDSERLILAIQPGSFQLPEEPPANPGEVVLRSYPGQSTAIQNIGIKLSQTDGSALREANVVVAAGRGIGDEENLDLIRHLSSLFARSSVGGSRPLCDAGWLEYNRQVGITGTTIAPDLYIACGISGTSQHVMGMKGSGYIVSINRDPNAAIFNVSDICIIEDLVSFIPVLLEEYRKRKELQRGSDPNQIPENSD